MSSPRCLGICEKMKYSKVYIIADTSRREVAHGARLILQLVGVWEGCHVTVREGKCRECINIIHSEL